MHYKHGIDDLWDFLCSRLSWKYFALEVDSLWWKLGQIAHVCPADSFSPNKKVVVTDPGLVLLSDQL